jgi:hypothetical protein
MTKILYRSGGNPPISPGLFLGDPDDITRHVSRLKRLAYWPAGIAPTEERVLNIALLCEARKTVMDSSEVLQELVEAGLVEEKLL